jgi:N-hydroxyarylamine O-acetyltransferase
MAPAEPAEAPAAAAVDLDAYLDRIGVAGGPGLAPTLATLQALHLGHSTSIPFENLDILLGRPIRLDLASLQAKLVVGRRGGYCFEHNQLFAAVLEVLGFPVTRLAARVYMGERSPGRPTRPKTHMLLRVEADGISWLADVGFGRDGLLQPVPFEPGPVVSQQDREYQIVADGPERLLRARGPDGWLDLYGFTLEPQYQIDYVVANHYTSTYPNSPFVQGVVVQAQQPGRRWSLRGIEYAEEDQDGVTRTEVSGDDAILALLAERFGLTFPPGTRFRPAQRL